MCTSTTATSFSALLRTPALRLYPVKFPLSARVTFLSRHSFKGPTVRFFGATATRNREEVSWMFPENSMPDGCGGWAVVESPITSKPKKAGFQNVLAVGSGTSIVFLLAVLAYSSLARRGFKSPYRNPSHYLHDVSIPSASEIEESTEGGLGASAEDGHPSEAKDREAASPAPVSEAPIVKERPLPRLISASVDSTQEEALSLLKKMKIIEDDVKGHELCSRRDYARWLVRASSLERNPKRKIIPPAALSGSIITAYEDVGTDDPDFRSIQALAEAGIVLSKLSRNDAMESDNHICFDPERLLSRHDLIDWRAQLEYDLSSARMTEMSKAKWDFMDVREISLESSPGLFLDIIAGERSLLRNVFGQSRRLQPKTPVTKAQAAVVLTSGRLAEAIRNELLRMEAEESSRLVAREEIKKELLEQGEIQRYWDDKLEEEKDHMLQAEQRYVETLDDLEEEKIVREEAVIERLKERAAIDCQKQLLRGLEVEVDEMSERLELVHEEQIAQVENLKVVSNELLSKKEGILDAKSWLEAEIEALRILRSWIEDEARKSRARALVLEEVTRRWRWNSH